MTFTRIIINFCKDWSPLLFLTHPLYPRLKLRISTPWIQNDSCIVTDIMSKSVEHMLVSFRLCIVNGLNRRMKWDLYNGNYSFLLHVNILYMHSLSCYKNNVSFLFDI